MHWLHSIGNCLPLSWFLKTYVLTQWPSQNGVKLHQTVFLLLPTLSDAIWLHSGKVTGSKHESSEIMTGADNFKFYAVSASGSGFGAFICSCDTRDLLNAPKLFVYPSSYVGTYPEYPHFFVGLAFFSFWSSENATFDFIREWAAMTKISTAQF